MKNLFLFVSAISLSIAFSSCAKDSVKPTTTSASKTTTSTTGNGSEGTTATTTAPATPTINDVNLQGNWIVVSDSSFWAGEIGTNLVSAYKGKSGDAFNFSADGKLCINEDATSDTTTYSVDPAYRITVTYADSKHFNEAPGFALGMGFPGINNTIYAYFYQTNIDANTLILNSSIGSPGGVGTRVIYLKR